MNLDKFIEVFVSSLMIIVLVVVTIYIISPNVGTQLINILPDLVNALVYLFIPALLIILIYDMLQDM